MSANVPDGLLIDDFGDLLRKKNVVERLADETVEASCAHLWNGDGRLRRRHGDDGYASDFGHGANLVKNVVARDAVTEHEVEDDEVERRVHFDTRDGVFAPALKFDFCAVLHHHHLIDNA